MIRLKVMKVCSHCKVEKPTSDFNVKRRLKSGEPQYQPYCRECNKISSKAYYAANKEKHVAVITARKKRTIAENRQKLLEYYTENPCMDCGIKDLRVLEPDHRENEDKEYNVSRLLTGGYSWAKVLTELRKCDIVCSNCHKIRTYSRLENCYRIEAL